MPDTSNEAAQQLRRKQTEEKKSYDYRQILKIDLRARTDENVSIICQQIKYS